MASTLLLHWPGRGSVQKGAHVRTSAFPPTEGPAGTGTSSPREPSPGPYRPPTTVPILVPTSPLRLPAPAAAAFWTAGRWHESPELLLPGQEGPPNAPWASPAGSLLPWAVFLRPQKAAPRKGSSLGEGSLQGFPPNTHHRVPSLNSSISGISSPTHLIFFSLKLFLLVSSPFSIGLFLTFRHNYVIFKN